MPTTSPPMMPVRMPEAAGAPEAMAMPMHSGSATRKTTKEAEKACQKVVERDGPAEGGSAATVGSAPFPREKGESGKEAHPAPPPYRQREPAPSIIVREKRGREPPVVH